MKCMVFKYEGHFKSNETGLLFQRVKGLFQPFEFAKIKGIVLSNFTNFTFSMLSIINFTKYFLDPPLSIRQICNRKLSIGRKLDNR